jgi:hypothetical protein
MELYKQGASLQKDIKQILEGNVGNLSDSQVINLIGIYSGKVHNHLQLWWEERCIHNHIIENPELVKQRYTDKYFEVITKWRTELSQFKFSNISINKFDDGGLALLYTEIFKVLFEMKLSLSNDAETKYDKDKLPEFLDRQQSILMGAARVWCNTSKTLFETLNETKELDLNKNHNVEWLTDSFKEFNESDPSNKK